MYRAANQTGDVRRESTIGKKEKLTPSRRRRADTAACTVRSGERGGEQFLPPDVVSEIRGRKAEETADRWDLSVLVTGTAFLYLPGTSVSSARLFHNTRNFCDFCNAFAPVPGTSVRSPYPYPELV